MKRRLLVATAALAAACVLIPLRAAATEHRYVAVSLVGDELTYVGAAEGVTGTLHPRGATKVVPMAGAPFDRTVLEVLAGSVPRASPGATLSFLAMSAPEAFAHQEDWFDGRKVTLPPALRSAIDQVGATELLLVTKIRDEARVGDGETKFGVGKLTGLGFYVDRNTDMYDSKVGAVHGFIAPYVYVKLSVIDLASSTVTSHRIVESAKPYTSLDAQSMMDTLQQTLVEGLTDAVQRLLKAD